VARLLLIEALGPMADDGGDTLARWRAALAGAGNDRPARAFAGVEDALAARCRVTGQNPAAIRPIVARGVRAHAGGVVWRSDTRLTATTPVRIGRDAGARAAGRHRGTHLAAAGRTGKPWLPHALLRARAACVPRITIDTLAGGHHLHGEQPVQVAARLHAFLHRGD
ncbi:alpha/beta fold family hydrolase, partial [mine drainage metagenome]